MRSLELFVVSLCVCGLAQGHVANHPSIHDTVAGILQRLQAAVPAEDLTGITPEGVIEKLTPEEKEILATEQLVFTVNVPVAVTVFREAAQGEVVFWLKDQGFEKTEHTATVDRDRFEAWQKQFDAGEIGLGVNSLSGDGDQYFVSLAPQDGQSAIEVTDIYPGQHTVGTLEPGARAYIGWDDRLIAQLSDGLRGQMLIRGDMDKRRSAKLTNIFRMTEYPAAARADQITLTWAGDPRTTQTVQWRTSTTTESGAVRFRPAGAEHGGWTIVGAEMHPLENFSTVNDPVVHRFTANLEGLTPGSTYAYAVGDGSEKGWSETLEFRTAPADEVPFKFVYMGDAQNGLDTWGNLIKRAHAETPEAAFYIMAGDLVNRGNERDDWDSFFHNATGVFDRRQLVPAIGNHEDQGDNGPWMYLSLFDLPENGPETITTERAYSFEYSNALFVVLDSNVSPALQHEWLDQQLANSDKTWKFAIYHHPAYSSGPNRNNPEVRAEWCTLFDKYHLDLALQGHDHAYLRTWPMKGEKRVGSAAEGTIYIVSVSGTKFYEQGDFDYTEFGMTNTATYQVLDLEINGNKLTYKAYDAEGVVRDEFVIEK